MTTLNFITAGIQVAQIALSVAMVVLLYKLYKDSKSESKRKED